MNKLVTFPLFLFIIFNVLWILMGNIVTPEGFDYSGQSFQLNYNTEDLLTAGLFGLVAAGALIGIQIWGTGLSDESVRMMAGAIIYGTIWTSLVILGKDMIQTIPVFGVSIVILLSVLYVIGVLLDVTESGGI